MGQTGSREAPKEQIQERMQNRWENFGNQINQQQSTQQSADSGSKPEDQKEIKEVEPAKKIEQCRKEPENQKLKPLVIKKEEAPAPISDVKIENLPQKIQENTEPKEPPKEEVKKEEVKEEVKKEEEKKEEKKEEEKKEEPKKKVNIEQALIEKVFQISLDEKGKFFYFELYLAQLLSENKEVMFKIEDLDEIIMALMNDSPYKERIISYLFECYHRAFEIIDRKYKGELPSKFSEVKKIISSYLGQIISCPENFGFSFDQNNIQKDIEDYFQTADEEEFLSLLGYFVETSESEVETMKKVLYHLFQILQKQNFQPFSFFKCESIRKSLKFLTLIIKEFPSIRKIFSSSGMFCPKNVQGQMFQRYSFLGPALSLCPFESEKGQIKSAFPRQLTESEAMTKSYWNKLNSYIEEVLEICLLLLEKEECKDDVFDLFYSIVNLNVELEKMNPNFFITSSIGYVMNCFILGMKIFINESKKINQEFNPREMSNLFSIVKYIDILYCNSNKKINFEKFEEIGSEIARSFKNENLKESEEKKYNTITELYFINSILMHYFVGKLKKTYEQIVQRVNTAVQTFGITSEQTRDAFIQMKVYDIYLKSSDFHGLLRIQNEITTILIYSLNSKKYNFSEENKAVDFSTFYDDFFQNIDGTSNIKLSLLPRLIINNIIDSFILLRGSSPEIYFKDFNNLRHFLYFAIIYSSRLDLIHNPHLRSEILDIILYTFVEPQNERNKKQILSTCSRLIREPFINEEIIVSLMRVFIDAQRLGTSNQYYEKFSVRNKVLMLVDSIFKNHDDVFKEKMVDYAEKNQEDIIRMLNLLMEDVSFLVDEVIMKLIEIKNYQDLKDSEEWGKLDEEQKNFKDQAFRENDRILKPDLSLLNSSLKFMVMICSCLQKYFLSLKLAERLANLLNFCLDEFTSKSAQLKVKNKADYNFKPSFILVSLIKIYVFFNDCEEFLHFIVSDKRCYKIDNFRIAIEVVQKKSKVNLDFGTLENFINFVNVSLPKAEEYVKSKQVSYEDAPEEFLDPLTSELMEDPVILPVSKMVVDRAAIETQLISNPIDPYNRTPLTKEMLIPNTELKQKIEEYKKSKITQKDK